MKNILIVDDIPQNLYLLRTLLSRHGYRVTGAANGAEALEKARSERPDMVISDILMPMMDGFELCREWKRDGRLTGIPFVFYTATYTDPKDEKFALGLGAERFVVKPQETNQFLGMIEEVFSEHKAGRVTRPCETQPDEGVFIREYNEVLIRKLEDKMVQVEEGKRRLEREVAGHMRAEKALQLSVTYNRSLIEASLDPLVTIDAAGKITDVNSATEKVTGCPRERLLGTELMEYFTDPEKARAGFQLVFREGAVQGYPLEIRHRDGSVTPVLYNASVYRDESGEVLGVFAAARDISEQNQAYIAIQRREEELRTILRTAMDGFWVTDRKGRFLEVNDAICRNLGYGRDELLRMSVSDIEVVEKPEEILRTVQRIMERGSDQFEGLHRCKDGSLRNVEISVNYLPPPHDRFFAFLRDITERKRGEEAFKESEEKFRIIFDNASDGILMVEKESMKFEMGNRKICEMLGYCEEEMAHMRVLDFHPEKGLPYVLAGFQRGATGGTNAITDVPMKKKDGSVFFADIASSLVAFKGKEFLLGIFRDRTHERMLQQQLHDAQKMEALGTLAGGIAHDFNNLLTVVLGHAELALNEISPMSPAHGNLTEITTAAQRAADLSLQMLAYTGKAVFAAERVALGDLVEEMAHLIKPAISKKATLTLNLERALPPIQADPSQIRQIVMNLIINASEAIGDRSGVITVSVGATQCDEEYLRKTELREALSPGLYVRLEVTDTGIGMDAGTRSRIFEPFFSTKFTGRGLGLAA
ncbi:MAG: hybrid sensor histidine kinase/response regulator, partial [Desulfobacteria bacterium]